MFLCQVFGNFAMHEEVNALPERIFLVAEGLTDILIYFHFSVVELVLDVIQPLPIVLILLSRDVVFQQDVSHHIGNLFIIHAHDMGGQNL